jgi:hypothetical protein
MTVIDCNIYNMCGDEDCIECDELFTHGIATACDECDLVGNNNVDSWMMLDDGRVLCCPCQNKFNLVQVNEDGYEEITKEGLEQTKELRAI